MNYKYLFIEKAKQYLDKNKLNIPQSIYNIYKNENIYIKREFSNYNEVYKEFKCLVHFIESVEWKENILFNISINDIFLQRGYTPVTFAKEIQSVRKNSKDYIKFLNMLELSLDEILQLTPPIIINLKHDNGINICDGYHRVLAALSKQDSVEFPCTLGKYKDA